MVAMLKKVELVDGQVLELLQQRFSEMDIDATGTLTLEDR